MLYEVNSDVMLNGQADKCYDPSDIFTFLESNRIGVSFAKFYIAWATYLEAKFVNITIKSNKQNKQKQKATPSF
jgi:hypothetical protein